MCKVHNKTHSGRHTAANDYSLLQSLLCQLFSSDVRVGAECFMAAQLYIQLSLTKSNIYDGGDVDDSKKWINN
jgi:hypothetical protein